MNPQKFKKGSKVAYRLVGWGITNYEGPDEVTSIRAGRIYTETYDKYGFEWDEVRKAWRFSDGFSALKSTLVALDDEELYRFLQENAKGDRSLSTLLDAVEAHRANLSDTGAKKVPVATKARAKTAAAKARAKTKCAPKKGSVRRRK